MSQKSSSAAELLGHLLLGTFFGILLIKSEAVSWFRIQEMFRFQGIHMYGILGSGVAVAGLSLILLRKLRGLELSVKPWGDGSGLRYALGGTVFGLGWGLAGACPGPIYALIGSGVWGALAVLASALAGARAYAALAEKLPH